MVRDIEIYFNTVTIAQNVTLSTRGGVVRCDIAVFYF